MPVDTFKEFSQEEQAALAAALRKLPKKDQQAVLHSLHRLRRQARKTDSDRRTDSARRTLVGAHVSRKLAAQCKAASMKAGVSLYAWVQHGLVVALEWDSVAVPMLRNLAQKADLSPQTRAQVLYLLGLTNS